MDREKKVIVAGSFCTLHRGHRKLLRQASELAAGGKLYIGLTTDDYTISVNKIYCPSFNCRKDRIEKFLSELGVNFEIIPISDLFGFSLDEDFDFIVVSEETEENARKINYERIIRGLNEIRVYVVELELAEDLMPISSKRIYEGLIDENGKRIRKITVNVGSKNPVKLNAVKNVFSKYFKDFEIQSVDVSSEVRSQPISLSEIMRGAFNRAVKALQEGDYGIGIEAGVIYYEKFDLFLDVQYCFIADALGRVSFGHGSGFIYPQIFNEKILEGKEIEEIMEIYTNIKNIGENIGAIGYLSRGVLHREELTEQSVITALIPRLNPKLYKFWTSPLWKIENLRKLLI